MKAGSQLLPGRSSPHLDTVAPVRSGIRDDIVLADRAGRSHDAAADDRRDHPRRHRPPAMEQMVEPAAQRHLRTGHRPRRDERRLLPRPRHGAHRNGRHHRVPRTAHPGRSSVSSVGRRSMGAARLRRSVAARVGRSRRIRFGPDRGDVRVDRRYCVGRIHRGRFPPGRDASERRRVGRRKHRRGRIDAALRRRLGRK